MSIIFDGGNDSADGTLDTPIVTGSGMSMFCWFKHADHPVVNDMIMQIGQARGTNEDSLMLRTGSVDNEYECRADAVALSTMAVSKPGIDGVWTPALIVHHSTELRSFWLADQFINSSAIAVALGSVDELAFGENLNDAQDWAGQVAEMAVWDTELDADDWALLAAGTLPSAVQAANLRFYVSAATDPGGSVFPNAGLDTGGDLTISGSAAWSSDHPSMLGGASSGFRSRIAGGLVLGRGSGRIRW